MGAKLADRGDHHISKTAVPVAVSKDIAVTLVERQCAGGYGNNQAETNTRQHRMVRRDP